MAKARAAATSAVAARWAKRVERLERSGLSIRAFAEREGLKAGSLSVWRWKLAQGRGQRPEATPVGFIELTAAPPAAPMPAVVFEVLLRSGRAVRVPGGFDAAELARLVGALEEACA